MKTERLMCPVCQVGRLTRRDGVSYEVRVAPHRSVHVPGLTLPTCNNPACGEVLLEPSQEKRVLRMASTIFAADMRTRAVEAIASLRGEGVSQRELAIFLGLTEHHLSAIKSGKGPKMSPMLLAAIEMAAAHPEDVLAAPEVREFATMPPPRAQGARVLASSIVPALVLDDPTLLGVEIEYRAPQTFEPLSVPPIRVAA